MSPEQFEQWVRETAEKHGYALGCDWVRERLMPIDKLEEKVARGDDDGWLTFQLKRKGLAATARGELRKFRKDVDQPWQEIGVLEQWKRMTDSVEIGGSINGSMVPPQWINTAMGPMFRGMKAGYEDALSIALERIDHSVACFEDRQKLRRFLKRTTNNLLDDCCDWSAYFLRRMGHDRLAKCFRRSFDIDPIYQNYDELGVAMWVAAPDEAVRKLGKSGGPTGDDTLAHLGTYDGVRTGRVASDSVATRANKLARMDPAIYTWLWDAGLDCLLAGVDPADPALIGS